MSIILSPQDVIVRELNLMQEKHKKPDYLVYLG